MYRFLRLPSMLLVALLVLAGLFAIVGSFGLIRLPDPLTRYQRLLERMIAKRPEDRIACAAHLIEEIRETRVPEGKRHIEARTHPQQRASDLLTRLSGLVRTAPLAVKTSAGALHRLPVCRHQDLYKISRYLQESGLRLFAATEKASDTIYASDMSGPAALSFDTMSANASSQLAARSLPFSRI